MEASFDLPIQSPTAADFGFDEPDVRPQPASAPRPRDERNSRQQRDGRDSRQSRPRDGRTTLRDMSEAIGVARGKGAHRRPSDRHAPRPGTRLRMRLSPRGTPKPLLPATERKGHEDYKAADTQQRTGKDTDDRADLAPDGSSAGREGRQFTVANVGNNGRIYLRPTVRPAHLRFPQPNFVFPITPPGTAGLDALLPDSDRREQRQPKQPQHSQSQPQLTPPEPTSMDGSSFLYGSDWTPDQASPTLTTKPYPGAASTSRLSANYTGGGHRRAVSDSTVRDTSVARESEPGGFKIVITQPMDNATRAKTLEDLEPQGHPPLLEVSIPTWKLGTPRFSLHGTPVLRGSSYAPTEEVRSSRPSYQPAEYTVLRPQDLSEAQLAQLSQLANISHSLPTSPRLPQHSRPQSSVPKEPFQTNYLVVDPSMFDSLTFKPACDDRSIVRFSPATGVITAATPPRLVAEITSPKFMDYDLVSDFFLTYRSFLNPNDLLRMLVARLRWALARSDEVGTVVRVRTFVALRHWILNYFMDDFVVDYGLRELFCSLVNSLVDDLSQEASPRNVPLKILTELKKCWRRSCSQYWDGREFDDSMGPSVPILPGGIAGHRNPNLDPTFWERAALGDDYFIGPDGMEFSTFYDAPEVEAAEMTNPSASFAAGSRVGHNHMDSIVLGDRPATPENQSRHDDMSAAARRQTSPLSVTSLDFVSCSFPTKNLRLVQAGMGMSPAAHPVDPSLVYSSSGPVAMTPRALMGKRVRPSQSTNSAHKRSNSQTDYSMHDASVTSDKLSLKNTEYLLSLPYAGSLVRGAMFPPSQPYVEMQPCSDGGTSRQTTLFQPHALEPDASLKEKASAMSGQGMRKLLGSVRRALSTRGQTVSPTNGNFINISPIGPRGATTNRLPGTAVVPQARPQYSGVRSPVRIDLLGAKIAEDFKKALREDASADASAEASAEASKRDDESGTDLPIQRLSDVPDYPAPASLLTDGLLSDSEVGPREGDKSDDQDDREDLQRPFSDTAMTTGSKSIVIVDDTLAMDFPFMTGALPATSLSVDAFGADPTPPTTPPGQAAGTPRRSSYLLGSRAAHPSPPSEPLPPFVPDLASLGHGEAIGEDAGERQPVVSVISVASTVSDPVEAATEAVEVESAIEGPKPGVYMVADDPVPLARLQNRWRGHARHTSSRSYASSQSFGRQRFASLSGSVGPHAAVLSFDASTFSGGSVDETAEAIEMDKAVEAAAPAATRVLRRRPGGDLRAVTNVGDLDMAPLRRSRSVGSLTTYTDSIRSSYMRSQAPESRILSRVSRMSNNRFSVGMLTEQKTKRPLSLFSTHSSKPMMRPSFEAEAQKLAQIPDDEDDGGVEAALLKLEGKFEPKAVAPAVEAFSANKAISVPLSGLMAPATAPADVGRQEKTEHRQQHVDVTKRAETVEAEGETEAEAEADVCSFLSESGESYCSTPLLDRGLTDEGRSRRAMTDEWGDQSIFEDDDEGSTATPTAAGGVKVAGRSIGGSYEVIAKTGSLEQIRAAGALLGPLPTPSALPPMPDSPSRHTELSSFLDDSSDGASDLSSEMSEVGGESDEEADEFGPVRQRPGRSNTVVSRLPAHALGDPEVEPVRAEARSRPPSPPMTLAQALQMSPRVAQRGSSGGGDESEAAKRPLPAEAVRKISVHLPFVLAFESEVLAQQLTLIEKDALHEIDWKELIEMRWRDAENSDARSWVEFLRQTDARGVEVVIARFNIMVKWAISEVVLTQDVEERARCLIKLIHMAAHCRRYRNFATMSQLTMALTSNEVARLSRTWALVPRRDEETLRALEVLVSPTRNFYALRAEMEAVGIASADAGCIPFVGIYTHDLLFNAQRPSEVTTSPTAAPLVNFERCRVAAGTVKTLLRLVEASALYTFQPIEGVTERCLWMSALTDEAIRRHSEGLE